MKLPSETEPSLSAPILSVPVQRERCYSQIKKVMSEFMRTILEVPCKVFVKQTHDGVRLTQSRKVPDKAYQH